MLNLDPKNLSVDRLIKIKNNSKTRQRSNDGEDIGLFDDIPISIKGKKKRSTLLTWKNY